MKKKNKDQSKDRIKILRQKCDFHPKVNESKSIAHTSWGEANLKLSLPVFNMGWLRLDTLHSSFYPLF